MAVLILILNIAPSNTWSYICCGWFIVSIITRKCFSWTGQLG